MRWQRLDCYCVKLVETNSQNQTQTVTNCDVTVADTPVVNFSFVDTQGCCPLTVSAICNSIANCGVIDQIVIDWGCGTPYNGTSCTNTPITHTYTCGCGTGYHSPQISVKNSCGGSCWAHAQYIGAVHVIPPPVANFTAATTDTFCTNQPLTTLLTADSTDPNLTYKWLINGSPIQSGPLRTLTYSFPVSGSCYTVTLIVVHPSGCSDTLTRTNYICVNTSPIVSFSQNITTACVNAQNSACLTLQNTSSGIGNLTWHMTGYGYSYGPSETYCITVPGTYTVTATGQWNSSCIDSITQQVFVANLRPTASFSSVDTFSCSVPYSSSFTSPGCGGCTYAWSFPGGVPATSTNKIRGLSCIQLMEPIMFS